MTSYRAVFRCIAGCHGEHPIWQPIYHCPTCGQLLQVAHDIDALRHRSPVAWMRLFDDRYKRTAWPYGSGVWGKKEWICPEIRDENVVSMDEGGTNIFWAERYGRTIGIEDLWVKMCGNSHTGSFKDLGMTVLVSVVKQMENNPRNVVGKDGEMRLIQAEMRTELAEQIMRRIGFFAASRQPQPASP